MQACICMCSCICIWMHMHMDGYAYEWLHMHMQAPTMRPSCAHDAPTMRPLCAHAKSGTPSRRTQDFLFFLSPQTNRGPPYIYIYIYISVCICIYLYIYDMYMYSPSSPSSVGPVVLVPPSRSVRSRSHGGVGWGLGGSIYGYIHGPSTNRGHDILIFVFIFICIIFMGPLPLYLFMFVFIWVDGTRAVCGCG